MSEFAKLHRTSSMRWHDNGSMMFEQLKTTPYTPLLGVALCMLIAATTNTLANSGITVFDEAFLTEFGWSVGELKLRDSITFLGAAVLVLLAGVLVDRVGFKPPLLIGLAVLAGAYFAYGFVQTLPQIYVLHGFLAMVLAFSGNMVTVIAAVSIMPERRGLAVGMVVAGSSIGGIFLPPLATWLILSFGWRDALRFEALIPVFVFVIAILFLRNRIAGKKDADANEIGEGVSYARAIASPQIYLITLAAGFTYYSVVAVAAHLFLYMRTLDFSIESATLSLSLFSFAGLVGKLSVGWLSDNANPLVLLRCSMVAMLLGVIGVFHQPAYIWAAILVTGLGWGGLHTLYNYVLLFLFGLRAAGKINATVSVVQALGAGLGAAVTGWLFDYRGDYSLAFTVITILMLVGLLLTLIVRPLKEMQTATA